MFGIKKMLKDDDATGIVGAISACLPFSVLGGGAALITTVIGGIISLIVAAATACFGCVSCASMFWCLPADLCYAAICSICPMFTLLIDAIIGIGVGTVTTCAAAIGTMFDHIIACSPLIATCCTPLIGVCAAAASAVVGAFGCSLGTGITGTLGIVGSLGEIISDMF